MDAVQQVLSSEVFKKIAHFQNPAFILLLKLYI